MVLSVQFEGDPVDDTSALGLFWPKIRKEFPNLERHPPVARASEEFEIALPQQPQVKFEFGTGPGPDVPQRYWLLGDSGNDLVQVQSDRLMINWRRLDDDEPYPRYEYVRQKFVDVFPQLIDAMSESDQPPTVEADWCEITYINQIEALPESGHGHMELSRILQLLDADFERTVLPAPEGTGVQEQYLLKNDDGPYGRFYLNATPAMRRTDNAPGYTLTLLVRGRPSGSSLDEIVKFFDDGRELIVKTFREATTKEMHQKWGLDA